MQTDKMHENGRIKTTGYLVEHILMLDYTIPPKVADQHWAKYEA